MSFKINKEKQTAEIKQRIQEWGKFFKKLYKGVISGNEPYCIGSFLNIVVAWYNLFKLSKQVQRWYQDLILILYISKRSETYMELEWGHLCTCRDSFNKLYQATILRNFPINGSWITNKWILLHCTLEVSSLYKYKSLIHDAAVNNKCFGW